MGDSENLAKALEKLAELLTRKSDGGASAGGELLFFIPKQFKNLN
jgi:hypothetical protein